jgi:DNA helicase-2/ATP-dependent DNA helicase PcrA
MENQIRRIRIPKKTFSEEQKRVIDWEYGPVFVDATAGSGKSACLIERIATIINKGLCKPEQILATTFTKKAAEEMNVRLLSKGIDTERMSVQTTHSFCFRVMRNDNEFKSWNFDEKDRAGIILKIILSYKNMDWKGCDQSLVEKFISNCRNTLTTPDECAKFLTDEFVDSRYMQAYQRYDAELASSKLYTFDDMLYHGVRILRFNQRTLEKYRAQYQFVMVDETQDNNFAQIEMCNLIAAPEYNLYVTGDLDQCIYKFRGATPEWLIEFSNEATVLPLGKNYRSCPEIVEASRRCIENNVNRTVKEIVAHRTAQGSIVHHHAENTDEEALFVANKAKSLAEDGMNYGKMFVLMRTNAQSRPIEEKFTEKDIPFIVLGAA